MTKVKNKRASIKRTFSNIAWLCKPYWQEKKLYFILFILFGVAITPIQDFIYVYFPKQIVDMLSRGDSFRQVATYALGLLLISYILIILPIIFQRYFTKSGKYVNLRIKRSIYEQALGTDYRLIDNPEYYDKYVWALDEYAEQAKAARDQVKFFLTLLASIGVLFSLIASGRINEVGQYITMPLAFYRIDEKLIFLLRSFAGAHELSLNAEKIREFFALEPEIEKPAPANALVPAAGPFSLQLENVHFAYPESGFALSGIDLAIRPGEKIAIVGENGAGKSTLMKLLLRLYDVDVSDGAVRINGQKIEDYDIHALRKQIGVAFQTSNVYAMT